MADPLTEKKKRKNEFSDKTPKRFARHVSSDISRMLEPQNDTLTAGKIHRIFVRNFMCHEALEIVLNPNVNFIIGHNGSGKSALLTALTIGLGARAGVTSRGKSVKDFVKSGRTSATIEVSLINEGPSAFKPEDYGKMITVVRHVGASSSYKLKAANGRIVSEKKDELVQMLKTMHIQVENPISVLNQDVSREFLVSSNPSKKYQLFMQATQLDVIGNNYKECQVMCDEAQTRLQSTISYLADKKKEVLVLENRLKVLKSVDGCREELAKHQQELSWAMAIPEEAKLEKIEKNLRVYEERLNEIDSSRSQYETKRDDLTSQIEKLQQKIAEIQEQEAGTSASFKEAKDRYVRDKEVCSNKMREKQTCQAKIKRSEANIAMVCQEIKRLESSEDGQNKKARLTEDVAKLKNDLEEVEALLRTKQTDQMHLMTDQARLEQEEVAAREAVQDCDNRVRKEKHNLASLKQQSDSSVIVFGSNVPRLLKRIDEEHSRGRFKVKPIGPVGAFVKIKDPSWTPAVESHIGASTLKAFLVDNTDDARTLGSLLNEIYRNGHPPTVIASRFFDRVHDVSQHSTGSDAYKNLFDLVEISDPVVANCLIDQTSMESTLLIPTRAEACQVMSERRRVPRNCARALTKDADEFFPDPNYRIYSGNVGKARYLQVSTLEAIQISTDNLATAEEELLAATNRRRVIRDKKEKVLVELGNVRAKITKLRAMQHTTKTKINTLADELDTEAPTNTEPLLGEKEILERRLEEEKEEEQKLAHEADKMKEELKELEVEVKRLRELIRSVDAKVNGIKDEIANLEHEKNSLRARSEQAERQLSDARHAVQKTTAEYDIQKRTTQRLLSIAEEQCPRINTTRSVAEIKQASSELSNQIAAVEQEVGSRETLETALTSKRQKYEALRERTNCLKSYTTRLLERLEKRRNTYKQLKKHMSFNVQSAFTRILNLRQYQGSIKICHKDNTLDLEVTPQNIARKEHNDARTLSGGERSYSTVAFILALWECSGLPFYFLDEFDVFMDKVNRRIILDILLQHTRAHPHRQYTFLTPLDTTIADMDNFLTIHQLAPPERHAAHN